MSLKYHAPSKSLLLPADALRRASLQILASIADIRKAAGLPLDRYKREGPLTPADLAQQNLVSLARDLGIDLGAEWANELDLREMA